MVTLKEFVGCYPTNCLSVVDHFVGLTFKGLRPCQIPMMNSFAKIVTTAVNYFLKKSLSETFERLNTSLPKFK